jgi:HEAT repeat protein
VTDEQPPTPRSRRLYILWAIALTLLLTAALFCWLVVVPVWRVRTSTFRCEQVLSGGGALTTEELAQEIKKLGGPGPAARHIGLYMRLPTRLAPYRNTTALMLMGCSEPGLHVAFRLLRDRDWRVRVAAVRVLGEHDSSETGDAMVTMLEDEHKFVRQAAAEALERIRAVPSGLGEAARLLAKTVGGKWKQQATNPDIGPMLVSEVPPKGLTAGFYGVVPFPFDDKGQPKLSRYVSTCSASLYVLGTNEWCTVITWVPKTSHASKRIVEVLKLSPPQTTIGQLREAQEQEPKP